MNIEEEIQSKGLTAPRVTPADIQGAIASEHYFTATDALIGHTRGPEWQATPSALDRLTFCVLVLMSILARRRHGAIAPNMTRAALLFLLCMSAAVASPLPLRTEIPSAVSGRYATPNGDCSVVFLRFGQDHVNVDIACPGELDVIPAGVRCFGTCSHSTVFAFRGACPGAPGVAYVFPVEGRNPSSQWLAFDAVDGADLIIRRGVTAAQLYNGGGVAERWTRDGWISSPSPYACGAARFSADRKK